jgi:hypothetical protein
MTDVSAKASISTSVPPADLGGPGRAVIERCSRVAVAALAKAAGEDFRMTSLSLDVASHPLGEVAVEITARVDKRTGMIVFASVEARSEGRMVFSGQGLFCRG